MVEEQGGATTDKTNRVLQVNDGGEHAEIEDGTNINDEDEEDE